MANDLREVARLSGVSVSTASRALSGSPLVSAATRLVVEGFAAAIGYRPNASARALRTGGSRLVGLVITNLVNTSFRVIAELLQQRLSGAGHHLVLCITGGDEGQEQAALRTLMELDASGVVAVGSNSQAFAEVRARGTPVIHLGRRPSAPVGDCVLGDERGGARLAVELLVAQGHQRIAIAAGPPSVTSGRERLQGYRQALTAAGRPVRDELVRSGPFAPETGRAAVDELFALPVSRRPTALLVANHEAAYGVLPRLRELSVAVPAELSVICYEDAPIMAGWWPAVTVVDNRPDRMAELISELLLDRIGGGPRAERKPAVHRVPTRMIERDSVGRRPGR
jgi:LacI family transcriptional regulator